MPTAFRFFVLPSPSKKGKNFYLVLSMRLIYANFTGRQPIAPHTAMDKSCRYLYPQPYLKPFSLRDFPIDEANSFATPCIILWNSVYKLAVYAEWALRHMI